VAVTDGPRVCVGRGYSAGEEAGADVEGVDVEADVALPEGGQGRGATRAWAWAWDFGESSGWRSTSTRTRTISFPACAKNARSWRWKYPLVGPGRMSEKLSGAAGGNIAIRSCPVGGAGYRRGAMSGMCVRSTSNNFLNN
jgi:hypothetical protein